MYQSCLAAPARLVPKQVKEKEGAVKNEEEEGVVKHEEPTRKRVQRGSIQAVTLCEVNCIAKYTCTINC